MRQYTHRAIKAIRADQRHLHFDIGVGAALLGSAVIQGGMGLAGNALGGGSQDQMALETPEQKDARRALLNFAATGQYGNFKAGEAIPLGYGDFNATTQEQQGLSALQKLLASDLPAGYDLGDAALRDIIDTSQASIDRQFSPFQAQVQRQTNESNRALKRNAGFAGNLYSTDTIRKMGDIEARGNENLTSQLANLTNQALDRRLAAASTAYNGASARQNAEIQRISASQQYGDLIRSLNDSSIKARDQELLRRRQEMQLPIQALTSVAGTSSNFGVPSVQTSSPYAQLLNQMGGTAGQYLGYTAMMDSANKYNPNYETAWPSNMGPSFQG
jgi:hypothetical protein